MPLSSPWAMTSAPITLVLKPHEVVHAYFSFSSLSRNFIPNGFEKFWPSMWLVAICSAFPSGMNASTVVVYSAPANFSLSVFLPAMTGIAM